MTGEIERLEAEVKALFNAWMEASEFVATASEKDEEQAEEAEFKTYQRLLAAEAALAKAKPMIV